MVTQLSPNFLTRDDYLKCEYLTNEPSDQVQFFGLSLMLPEVKPIQNLFGLVYNMLSTFKSSFKVLILVRFAFLDLQ